MSAVEKDACIAELVRQIDECHERIRTLEAERQRLQQDLVAVQAQREDFAAKVYHATRRGW